MSSNKFMPQEFHVLSDSFAIRTRIAPENVTEDEILKTVRRNKLAAGDSVLIQCMSFNYDVVVAEVTYRVTQRKDIVKQVEDHDGGMKQVNFIDLKIAPIGDWVDYRKPKGKSKNNKQ